MGISEEVVRAFTRARARSGLGPEQFAREVNRLVPDFNLTAQMVVAIEGGARDLVRAQYLVAAARINDQPVSALLGELELYTVTLPALEQRMLDLEDRIAGREIKSA